MVSAKYSLLSVFILLTLFACATSSHGDYKLENNRLKVSIVAKGCVLEITDKLSGEVFTSEAMTSLRFDAATASSDSCYLSYSLFPNDISLHVTLSLAANSLVFKLSMDPETALSKEFKFPGPIESKDGDYYIVPHATGYIGPVTEAYPLGSPRGSFHMWGYKATMPFAGITDLTSGYMISSDDPWDTEISIARPSWSSPNYSLMLMHHPSKNTFGYDRTFHYSFFDTGGYVAMCEWYRGHAEEKGKVRTLREKAVDNPAIDRLIGAVDFWGFNSYWNENLIDKLFDYGFDKVLYTFTTNYVSFPDNSKVIAKAHEKGWLTSRYDCFTDTYPPEEHPEINWLERMGYPENVIINSDGSLRKGWITYLSDGAAFQCGVSCSQTHGQYARRKIAHDHAVNDYSARFIDVELASVLRECYSADHPASRHDDAIYRAQTLGIVKEEFGLVTGSEEARDWAFRNCDYGEGTMTMVAPNNAGYNWIIPLSDPGERFIDISMDARNRIPLHALVYHDCHVPTWYTGDGAGKVPAYWEHKDLFTLLYGTMHLFMPGDMAGWDENVDRFVTSYHATNAVFRNVGYEEMTSHEMLTSDFTVQKTTFANGWSVVANFGSSDYSYEGKTIPPLGFFAGNGNDEAMKVTENNGTYTAVSLENRLFLNPYGRQTVFKGVRSMGPVYLNHVDENHIQIAFIGDLKSVDIRPDELPWPAESIRIFDDNGAEVQSIAVGNGWNRIPRPGKGNCLTIEYTPVVFVDEISDARPVTPSLSVHPNPFNATATVSYELTKAGHVTVEIFNLIGQREAILENSYRDAGIYTAAFEGESLTSGIYFARMSTGENTLTQKLLLVK